MDVRLTEEQEMVRRLAADIARAHAPATVAETTDPGIDERAWRALGDAGLVALHVPEAIGGGGAGAVDVALVAEQLASGLVPAPFVGVGVWAPALLGAAAAGEVVDEIAAGRRRVAPVLTPDLRRLARSGEPGIAVDARGASAGVVLDEDRVVRLVDLGEPTTGVDLTRVLRRVPAGVAGEPVGAPLDEAALAQAEALALTVLAADLLGVLQRALDDAVAHVREREQFGVPVGSFQAVQHLAAHGAVLAEGTRSSVWHAAWAVDALEPTAALLAARQAKAYAGAAGRQVGELAIQLLGGIGLTWEHLAHVRQRRILLSREVLGAEPVQHAAIADARLAGRR